MASPTRWTWAWASSGSWWWTGRPGVLWFMGLQRVGLDWVTELNWTGFILYGTLCVWGLLFPGFKVEFFLAFGFCPPKFGPVVCGEICAELLFVCLFFLWWARLSEVVILSADDWACIYVFLLLLFRWGSCTGCYWWLGEARACIQVVSFVWVLTIWYSLSN